MAKQFTLGKNERLKSQKTIELLFKEGKKFSVNPYRVYYLPALIGIHPSLFTTHLSAFTIQFGIGVGTKSFKKAVDRNRIKRLTREAYRLQKHSLQEKLKTKNIQLNIFFIYTANELPGYIEVYKKVGVILQKMDTIFDEVK